MFQAGELFLCSKKRIIILSSKNIDPVSKLSSGFCVIDERAEIHSN